MNKKGYRKYRILCVVYLIFLSSCGYNNKEKLIGKWKVVFNLTSSPKLNNIRDWDKDSVSQALTKNESDFNGTIYDIKKDGSYSIAGKILNYQGNWEEKDGRVNFISGNKVIQKWRFSGNSVDLGQDSSIIPYISINDSTFIQLVLKYVVSSKG
jgi:hypothetical protein